VFSSQQNSNPEVPEALQCPRETSLAQVKRWLSLMFLEGNSMHSNHFTVALFSSFSPSLFPFSLVIPPSVGYYETDNQKCKQHKIPRAAFCCRML
jgi:hypothetical protein